MQKKLGFALLLQFSYTFIALMKPGSFTHKIFAVVLLLVFAQKMGGGLYLHNWLHVKSCERSIPKTAGNSITSYSCNCIDDFSMPLMQPASEIFSNVTETKQIFFSSPIPSHSFSFLLFNSLRAPPVMNC
jgi:hypothetical protein